MTSPGIKLNRSQEAAMRLVLERRGELSQGRVIHAEFVDGWLMSGNFTGDLYGIELNSQRMNFHGMDRWDF